MTVEEARQVAEVFAEADGGCPYCARALAEHAAERWPEHDWAALVETALTPAPLFPQEGGA